MRFAYRITKATVRHPEYVILLLHGNSGYANALRYGIRTLPVLLGISFLRPFFLCLSDWGMGCLMQMCITGKNVHSLTYPSSVGMFLTETQYLQGTVLLVFVMRLFCFWSARSWRTDTIIGFLICAPFLLRYGCVCVPGSRLRLLLHYLLIFLPFVTT